MTKGKKIGAVIAAMAMSAAVAVGGTLAYLNSVTETKTNTFSSSKTITTTIQENFDPNEASNYYPGKVITKEPTMTNTSKNEDIWVAVSLNYTNGASSLSAADFAKEASIDGIDSSWTKIGTNEYGTELYMYKTTLAYNASTTPIFSKVTVNTGIKEVKKFGTTGKIIYTKDGNGKLINVDNQTSVVNSTTYFYSDGTPVTVNSNKDIENSLPTFEINVKGLAVQADGVDAATAKTQLVGLANDNIGGTFQ